MNLPDPANIIFGTMMYSADQMREYAALTVKLASRQEQATAFAEQMQTVGIPSYERTTLVTSPMLPAADALEQLAELLPADVWWGDGITPSMLVDILAKYVSSRQDQPVPDDSQPISSQPLSIQLSALRAERPDEWTMDELIRLAVKLEAATPCACCSAGSAGRLAYVQGWNDCRDEMIAAALASPTVPESLRSVLEKIDLKAEAGLCQMTHSGTRAFCEDIRSIVAAAQQKEPT